MSQLSYREASFLDENLYLVWANDDDVRKNAFNSAKISAENHKVWFAKKMSENNTLLLVFSNELAVPVGQVRIDETEFVQVDISVDCNYRGKRYALFMLETAVGEYLRKFGKKKPIYSSIKKDNIVSIKIFEKVGFKLVEDNAHLQFNKYIFIP